MTTDKDRQAVDFDVSFEAAEEWIKTDYAKATLSLPIEQARSMMFEVFRAGFHQGISYARTPIKIDPNDESTWPSIDTVIIGRLSDGIRDWRIIHVVDKGIKYAIGSGWMTHWLPLPELPTVEDE